MLRTGISLNKSIKPFLSVDLHFSSFLAGVVPFSHAISLTLLNLLQYVTSRLCVGCVPVFLMTTSRVLSYRLLQKLIVLSNTSDVVAAAVVDSVSTGLLIGFLGVGIFIFNFSVLPNPCSAHWV